MRRVNALVERRFRFGDRVLRSRSVSIESVGERSIFVLIHGIGVSHRYFDRLRDQLAGDFDVHSIDLPGFGGLPKPRITPDIGESADLLGAVLDELGVKGAVVVGQSMGAQWVTELAARRADLAASVVLIGPVTDDAARSLPVQGLRLARDITAEPILTNLTVLVDYLRCGPIWFLRQCRFMIPYPIEERIAALRMPVLVLRGGNDPIAGLDWCRRLRARAVDSTLVTVPGKRHNVHHSAPRAVAGALTAFAGGTGAAR
jgi:pimeloyl-ACP methyl ester carboxylesterase